MSDQRLRGFRMALHQLHAAVNGLHEDDADQREAALAELIEYFEGEGRMGGLLREAALRAHLGLGPVDRWPTAKQEQIR